MPRRIGSHHVDLGATRELLPGIVSDSWLRSERLGLRRDDQAAPVLPLADLTTAREQNRWISHQAQPQLLNLLPALKNSPAIIVMSDARGLVLDTLGNPDFLHKAQRFALQPGSLWCENARGTNAIGTALATGDFCEVAGEQHYLSHNAGLYCAATPVYHPEGTIAGVLDLSTPASQPGRDAVTLIRRAVSNIEHDWACSMLNKARWLLRFYAPHDPSHEMVMAFHDDVLIGANRRAMQEFGLSSASIGNVAWQSLFNHRPGQHAAPVEACNNRRYQARQQTHQTARVTVPPVQEAVHPQALRLLNAGIALCITGETGSGKEHLCRALHQQSQWRNGPFVAINCAAVPENLIESELFGYVPGAFTGANPKGYEGKLREANNGVLFLDEIGDMPLAMQTRLLRVLQEKCVTPLGGNGRHNVNFALVCATHRDLQQCVAEGTFREDLLYRIQEFQLRLPPLREKADLAAFILTLWAQLGGTTRRITLSESLLATLSRLPWPGNVRQLLSFLKVLLALHDDGDVIDEETLPDGIVCPGLRVERATVSSAPPPDELAALREANGNMTLAARQLGISRSTLYRRLERRNAV